MKGLFEILLGCFLLTRFLSAEVLFISSFDDRNLGPYTRDMLFEDWTPNWENGLDEGRVSVVGLGEAFRGNGIRVDYPKGSVGPGEGGAQWLLPLPAYEEMYLTYYVLFPIGWDGKKGGKLPGLVGGPEWPTGGKNVTGSNGFSARYMWRPDSKLVIYLYHMDQPGTYGENFELYHNIETGKWIKFTQRIKMNTVGKSNGEVQVWVNDEESLFLTNIRFRTVESVKVDKVYFSTFYGGNTSDWGPVKDESIYFDEFMIYTDPDDYTAPDEITGSRVPLSSASDKISIKSLGNGKLVFRVSSPKRLSLQVTDIMGKQIQTSVNWAEQSMQLSERHISNGIFILNVNTSTGWISRRFAVVNNP